MQRRMRLLASAFGFSVILCDSGISPGEMPAQDIAYPKHVPEMESTLTTDTELSEILAELSRREPIFHRPSWEQPAPISKKMALDDFWEVGASGRRYSRTDVLDELERRYSVRHADVWESSEFHRRRLAPDVYC